MMNSLIKINQSPNIHCLVLPDFSEQLVDRGDVAIVTFFGGNTCGKGFENGTYFAERPQVANVNPGHEHPAPRIDIDEMVSCQSSQRLADGRAAQAEGIL
jgi:hypothetical protein